jgi:hypothetical protein
LLQKEPSWSPSISQLKFRDILRYTTPHKRHKFDYKITAMVSLTAVRAANAQIKSLASPITAVFIGGTNGIGRATLIELAKAKPADLKVYIVGRNRSNHEGLLKELEGLNPKGEFIFLEAQITLLAEVKRVCDDIISREESLDLLWMSAGALPFDGRKGELFILTQRNEAKLTYVSRDP